MALDRQAKRILDMLAAGGMPPRVSDFTASNIRVAMLRLARALDVKGIAVGKVEDRDLRESNDPLPVRIYTPASVSEGDESGGIVFFHGGAGVFCSIDTHDGFCRMLANASGCRIISVEYCLAPEHPFPGAVEDAYFATQWVCRHAWQFSIDPTRIAVAGDSAGGTLAAAVCQRAKRDGGPALALQVLLCPVTDLSAVSESWKTLGQGYFLDRATLDWAIAQYIPVGTDFADVRISPLRAPNLAGLPPAHIHTAEFDPLRDEGRAYADNLMRAGVPVRYICHEGMIHHFYCMAGAISYARKAVAEAGAAIRETLK
jgi:acetyl esterase/lipase